ncbi:chromosomal replication initiator protein DnaA [Companilactobacillus mishanensis]|uniref:Chromosomal replication initiator protein DnaA n=1 Tax=Companilactobacillus mishanensis TaxID=2486008 RepID=A0A5P0ZJC7_9LACO|nr:chromosomal replication initiator protein DnaA [Companilactobacillus mishanensis]MQS45022.1 chromosomal replication initiator protein DnaA [Companilactobacillus mishanensis]MQS53211.1 chromosomal replication initiator protein DnaA [Companilactobacillus mishanensis]
MNDFWTYFKNKIKKSLSSTAFDTWISTAKPQYIEGSNLHILVPSELHKTYWQKKFVNEIVLDSYEFNGIELNPVIEDQDTRKPETTTEEENQQNDNAAQNNDGGEVFENSHLNPKYTFDTFIVGDANNMAHAAAVAAAGEPGEIYNPLFIYGGVGLGKTHLMQAIGHEMMNNNPQARVKYVTSENFTNELIYSIQHSTQKAFREEYRNVDLLLIDDIQFLGNKEKTQEEFFHTFNKLHENNKQIVMTSDRLPNDINNIEARLVSRFKWGLSVDITAPDLETRIAILRNKAEAEKLEIPDDALSYIAQQINTNVRELEGALLRVQAYSTMKNTDIDKSLAADALKALKLAKSKSGLTVSTIQSKVCKYYHITIADLKGKKRVKSIVLPRQIAMYLSRELTDKSLPQIGMEFGGKDHTTVMHSCDKITELVVSDEEVKQAVEELKDELKN